VKTRALLLAAILLTAGPHPGCAVTPSSAHAPPSGGVYELMDGQSRVVYVGESGNLPIRMAYWKRAYPDLGGKVMIRSSDIRVRLGVEWVLYKSELAAADAGNYKMLNSRSPLDMHTPATLPEHQEYVRLGRSYLDQYGVLEADILNYGPVSSGEAP
jgi:hypothetical protein